jgi:hypothetical protein
MKGYREEGCWLFPRRKQRICRISAEIVGGKRVRSFLPYVAELPLIGLLSVAKDNDACRRGEDRIGPRQAE